ncbi:uncharacterized protein MONBRDRAFT_6371 [Monosiga brevicollis MX1]|uniref:3-hydroxyacyl-CoA dehydrogenase NAD binding domain-containing protein n=1 Tax=Monosiga brevicollis TaxID=81824 RepID=A9UTN2_MONBE|nr:uncharacterized protein MONBRDRAFT_6371 [Monosiga brevicollis MX1]EDQ91276.1 predicted protein [Monosiga brevicollis MX1]|eukprot:XP_001743698.1 hypothetical protein [Monosiga brevicollis MX1]
MSNRQMTVAVIGAGGVLGRGIVAELALNGVQVIAHGLSRDELRRGLLDAQTGLDRAHEQGLLEDDFLPLPLADFVTLTTNIAEAITPADLIIEAIPERPAAKRAIYHEVLPRMRADAILATTTMSLSVTELSTNLPRGERFLGLRFFMPVVLIDDVELTPGLQTSDAALEQAKSFLLSINKVPVYKRPGELRFLRLEADEVQNRQKEAAQRRRLRLSAHSSQDDELRQLRQHLGLEGRK